MKSLLLSLLLLAGILPAAAQFEQGTRYVSTSLTSLSMNYSSKDGFRIGLNAMGGYFLYDDLLVHGTLAFDHYARSADRFTIGAGVRHYFSRNGVSLGAGVEYTHRSPNLNDLRIPVELGYTFYLNHYIAIEPAIVYKASLNDFSDGSEIGCRLGLGFYF